MGKAQPALGNSGNDHRRRALYRAHAGDEWRGRREEAMSERVIGAPHVHDTHCPALCDEKVNRSDLEKVIAKGEHWGGAIVAVHRVGEYAVVEYLERDYRGGDNPNYGKLTGGHDFSVFINEYDIGRGFDSLDAALVGVVAYKREGCNAHADRYFMKATQPDDGGDCESGVRERYYATDGKAGE